MSNHDRQDDADEPGADAGNPPPPAHTYQEGSVQSVGGGPSGTDTDDRTGQPTGTPAAGESAGEPNRDIFISSEVAEESADLPGRPERTRS